jgi:cell division septation protein DedD
MSEKEVKRQSPGWIATLAGALLLIVLGFGVGLIAATVKEADLAADAALGNTTELPLPPQAPPRVREKTRDAGDEGALAADPGERATPAVSSAPPSGGFAVQVGAFATGASADGLAAELKKLGHPAYVADDGGAGARFKVRVGPIASRAEADALADRLNREQRLSTWVVARGGR